MKGIWKKATLAGVMLSLTAFGVGNVTGQMIQRVQPQAPPPGVPQPGEVVQPPGQLPDVVPGASPPPPAQIEMTAVGTSLGRQDPAVSLEWVGPPTAKVGQPVTYQLLVKNVSPTKVEAVTVRIPDAQGITIQATEPKAERLEGALGWVIGTLEPRQERRIDMQVLPGATGTVACNATVTFSGSSSMQMQVHQPKLTLKAASQPKAVAQDPATIMVTVTNPGDTVTERVKVKVLLSDGLEHSRGQSFEIDMGNLGASESRSAYVLCGAKTPGMQRCDLIATGEPGLSAQESVAVEVISPKLELIVSGPGMRYLDRQATFTYKVTNNGTAPANQVSVVNEVPPGFKVKAASDGGRHDFVTRTVSWTVGDMAPGESKEVRLELIAVTPGDHKNKAAVTAARGIRVDGEAATRIEGLPALLIELVDLDDPVEVGAPTSYEIRVTNTGTKTETNLQLICTMPDKMDFAKAKGPLGCNHKVEGKEIVFDALPKLAPRADAVYRVHVKGSSAGDLRFQARVKADGLIVPVLKEESTRVYGDDYENAEKPQTPLPPGPKP